MIGYTLDLSATQANLFLVIVALLVNVYAFIHANPQRRPIYAPTMVLCAVYIGSYLVLLGDFPERILEWSRIMRGVSLVAWVTVWIIPPLFDVKVHQERKAASDRLVTEVEERLKDAPV
jgi:hypothetical protein